MLGRTIGFTFILVTVNQAGAGDRFALATGAFTREQFSSSLVGIIEYRPDFSLLGKDGQLNPMLGFATNTQGGIYGYGGLRLVFTIHENWQWENAAGIGGYEKGSGPDLFGTAQFCLALALTHRIWNKDQIGFELFHISNAGLEQPDPGANSYLLTFEFPI